MFLVSSKFDENKKTKWIQEFSKKIISSICDPKNIEFQKRIKNLDDSAFLPILNAISTMKINDLNVKILFNLDSKTVS